MNGPGARALGALSLALAVTTGAPPAAADDRKAEAQTLFTQGMKLAESGDLRGALASFRAAHDKFPNYRVLYNVGQLCAKLVDPACTVRAYDQYLREGGHEVPARRRTEVETELQAARRLVAMLTITTSSVGAEISVDDVPVGVAPLPASIAVNPGSRSIAVTAEGKTASRTVKAAAGDTPSVDLDIPKDAPPPPVRAEDPPSDPADKPSTPPPTSSRKIPIVPWAITGGFAVVTIVSGILTASAHSTYTDKRDSFPVTRGDLDDAQGSARTLFLFTAVFGVLTVASAGVATWFTFRPATSTPTPTTGSVRGPSGLQLGVGPRGLAVSGTF